MAGEKDDNCGSKAFGRDPAGITLPGSQESGVGVDWRTFVFFAFIIIPPLLIIVEWIVEKHFSWIKGGFILLWIIICVFSTKQYSSDNSTMDEQKDTIDSLEVIARNSETTIDSLNVSAKKAEIKLDSIHQAIINLDKTKFSDLPLNEVLTLLNDEYRDLKKEIAEVEEKTKLPKFKVEFVVLENSKAGYKLILKLSPSNHITPGVMSFDVKLLEKTNAVINMFETHGASRKTLTKYSEDRRSASFKFFPSSYGDIGLLLILSELVTFEISSKGYLDPTRVKPGDVIKVNQLRHESKK